MSTAPAFEMDAMTDAMEELLAALVATCLLKGEMVETLRRDILAWTQAPAGLVGRTVLPGGVVAFMPPPEVPALLARARRLGVI